MNKVMKKTYSVGSIALLLATLCVFLPFSSVGASPFSAATTADTWAGTTTGWANVRTGTNTQSSIVTTYAPNKSITVYQTVAGQNVWGPSDWYRISDLNSSPLYIYSGLVNKGGNTSAPPPAGNGGGNSNTGTVVSQANIRSGPSTSDTIVGSDSAGTTVTLYQSVSGQNIWGTSTWYRISDTNSAARFIYGGLINVNSSNSGTPAAGGSQGKLIVIDLAGEWLHAYNNGQEVFNTPVLTGRPELPTPTGVFHIFIKLSPTTFYSSWPVGSPYYYAPTHINYAMEFLEGGYFLHDATWHSVFGPGTNLYHYDPQFGWQYGSHGCVTMPLSAAAWLYSWAPTGTEVDIKN
jgi:lipoprotein-anchoring transpeptidase ErfK/SrfK